LVCLVVQQRDIKKMQSFYVGKWHVLYLNPASYIYTF
jgi:hypothetical protein